MARTTPHAFFEYFVEENYCDFCECVTDIRLGFNASVTAFQMADVYWEFYKKHDPSKVESWPKLCDFHKYLSEREPLFLTVQSVATAYKHLYPKRGSFYEIGSPMALEGIIYNGGKIKIVWGEGGNSGVIVNRRGADPVLLIDALKAVLDLWRSLLPPEYEHEDL
jgi:hypothetical protein